MLRYIVLIAAVVLAALALFHPVPRPPAAARPAALVRTPRTAAPRRATIVVYVAGSVEHPGLFRFFDGARADDAVRRAGGFTRDADAAGVNLAQRLADGDEVDVPALGDAPRRRSTRRATHRPRLRRHRRRTTQ
jgi:competence protein ComEA